MFADFQSKHFKVLKWFLEKELIWVCQTNHELFGQFSFFLAWFVRPAVGLQFNKKEKERKANVAQSGDYLI